MRFDIVTIFPEFFSGPFQHGILSRALSTGLASAHIHDLRAFAHDRHKTVDDRPFGGGEGMVLKPGPIFEAVESMGVAPKAERDPTKETVLLLSAQGRPFTQAIAHDLAKLERVVLICGRYEGIDERVNQLLCDRELSIGDYVLSGGELPAAVIVDAVVRLLPGVLGNADSARFESFGHTDGLLDSPHYTRPAVFLNTPIPEVLSNGDHEAIRRWRRAQALQKTRTNRPDLLQQADLSEEDREFLRSPEE